MPMFRYLILVLILIWFPVTMLQGIYDSHIHLQGVPLLGWEPPLMSQNISAR